MADLSKITNERLRTLIEHSLYFKRLSDSEQVDYANKIANVPEADIEPLCKFFEEQNYKAQQSLIADLQEIYKEVSDLEQKIKKMLDTDIEKRSDEKDETRLGELLQDLDKI